MWGASHEGRVQPGKILCFPQLVFHCRLLGEVDWVNWMGFPVLASCSGLGQLVQPLAEAVGLVET